MPNNAALLELRGVSKSFGPSKALDGVSFDVRAGEIHALCGENGAGKSTLLKIIGGVWPHGSYEGEMLVRSAAARFRSSRDAQAAGVALIHQELALVPEMTVAENVSLGAEPSVFGFVKRAALEAKASKLFAELGLRIDVKRRVAGLGTGERQMVEIAKALAHRFTVLVLDEPTASLSEGEAEKLLRFLDSLREKGAGIVYVSHRLKEVFRIADRITVLRDGKSVATAPHASLDEARLVKWMVGRDLGQVFAGKNPARPGEEALRVENLTIPGAVRRTKPVSFALRAGEIVGLAGLVGSGRTELLETLFGLKRAPGARLRVFGRGARIASPRDAMRLGVALVSESRKETGLVVEQPVRANLTLAHLSDFTRAGFIAARRERAAAAASISAFGVKCASAETPVQNLSGGNQQKVVLAKWAARKPRILLLDEPTRGVDVGAKSEIYAWIRRWAAEGAAILLASSELPEVIGLSDRILVLSDKELTGEFDANGATEEKLMRAMTGAHAGAV